MFKSKNFCHIASNNRNQVKVGVFVYRTTDDLETVTASGYFNERIIDINLHDLIIHEQIDATDNTKVESNILCVSQRSLDNVGTVVVKTGLEHEVEELEQDLSTLQQYVDRTFVKKDGTSVMTGKLQFDASSQGEGVTIGINPNGTNFEFYYKYPNYSAQVLTKITYNGIEPGASTQTLGTRFNRYANAYIKAVNNGYDISVPVTNSADTLALKSQVDLAANSGTQLRDKGVWYAKMDPETTPPATAEVEGRNYADFTQVDGNNNPIIVIYTYTSGSWVSSETITPPASYNGYLPITSKFWDIQEQTGQQGGLVLWDYSHKTFTPYPRIISTDGLAIVNSTFSNGTLTNVITTMPATPIDKTVVNKKYVVDYVDSVFPSGSDYVVETQLPTALNNYTWYRKYKSGWVEQGGVTSTDGTQTLPVEMADTNYTALRTNGNGRAGTAANEYYTSIMQKTTTSIFISLDANVTPVSWEVKGVAA